jgi:hypothetical protein
MALSTSATYGFLLFMTIGFLVSGTVQGNVMAKKHSSHKLFPKPFTKHSGVVVRV